MAGFVVQLARRAAGLTQERLAERLMVDVSTVQAWESGRRPVSAMSAGEFVSLGIKLTRLGAPPSTGLRLREAIEADLVLSTGIAAGPRRVVPDAHPLAANVHRKTITNLITWPFTGDRPPELGAFIPKLARRGPVAISPSLGADERTRFFDHLLTVAERSTHPKDTLLRRQAVYLLGFDRRCHVGDWLRDQWRTTGHRRIEERDITGLLEARSAAVALASGGDSTHLHDFVAKTVGTRAEIANLNYWAHWIGESSDEHTDDVFMLDDDTQAWTGLKLLRHLLSRLQPESPHLPLNLQSVHTLVASRPWLLKQPGVRASLDMALERLTSGDLLTRTGRDHVAGLRYALRIADLQGETHARRACRARRFRLRTRPAEAHPPGRMVARRCP